ncbi:hypothetical protein BH10PSE13_BH10PSE13_10950 [soil metagenome]
MKRMSRVSGIMLSLVSASLAGPSATAQTASVPESETADVMKMEPPQTGWFYVDGGWGKPGMSIFDAKTGKMKGTVNTSELSDMAFDPAGKYYYVSESIWSKGNRGTRQDMVSVYDTIDMKLVTEITIPDRILIGERKQNFIVSDDGKWGFVYNLSPATSVNVLDLARRKFAKTIEVPGCAALIPNPVGFSALCSDGSMATVAVASGKITRSAPFFAATEDPIFENFGYDKAKKEVVMLSYTGLLYTATLAATPTISTPWSIQTAAGYGSPADTKPLTPAWYPGGRQPMALHRPSGHLFVLMHQGEYWSHKQKGTEIWEIDVAAKKVVKRLVVEEPSGHIEVTQDAEPMIFLNDEEGNGKILDAKTGEAKHKIKDAGGGVIFTRDPS